MLVELRVVDQRVSAVHEVLDGATVVGVAARYGVSRQTVHRWLRKYADDGVVGLVGRGCDNQRDPMRVLGRVRLVTCP